MTTGFRGATLARLSPGNYHPGTGPNYGDIDAYQGGGEQGGAPDKLAAPPRDPAEWVVGVGSSTTSSSPMPVAPLVVNNLKTARRSRMSDALLLRRTR